MQRTTSAYITTRDFSMIVYDVSDLIKMREHAIQGHAVRLDLNKKKPAVAATGQKITTTKSPKQSIDKETISC